MAAPFVPVYMSEPTYLQGRQSSLQLLVVGHVRLAKWPVDHINPTGFRTAKDGSWRHIGPAREPAPGPPESHG